MNPLLEKQLKEYTKATGTVVPEAFAGLLDRISHAYTSFENAITTCHQEKTSLHHWLKKERQEIYRRETHLALSQHIAKVGSWEIDLTNLENINANPLYWSDETYRIMGFTHGEVEVSNELFFSRVHPEDVAIIKNAIGIAITEGKVYDVEHRLLLPGGIEKIVNERSEITIDANTGRPIKMIGTIQDITEEKKARLQLDKTSHELQTMFENMQEGFFSVDEETGQMLQISKTCEKIWGYREQDFYKNPGLWFELVLEEDKHIIEANYPVMLAGQPFSHVYRIRHKDGGIRWLESKIIPTLNNEGRLVRIDGMTSDITARKEAEKKIADNALSYRVFFEQNLAGVYRTNIAGDIIYCNEAFAEMLGYGSPKELQHVNAGILYFAKPDREKVMIKLHEQKKLVNFNLVLKCSDGSPLYVMENVTLFTDPDTGTEFCDGIMINITERKKAEEELYNSEKRYRQIVETAQEGIWTIDEKDQTNFVNKKICAILEYTAEEMMGKGLYDFMDDEGKKYAIACMERRRNGSKENLDIRYLTKTGKEVWANISANPIFEDDGTYKGALAMVTDITDRKHRDELLQKSEANLRTIFDHTESAFVLIDADLKIVSFNSVAQTVMRQQNNIQLQEGDYIMDYFNAERKPVIQNIIERVMGGETISYQTPLKQADGTNKWYDVKWVGVTTNNDEKKWGIILSSIDISQQKTITLERERITADLVQRNKDLQQFNYIVSHNLRAPVANIMGLAMLLSEEDEHTPLKRELLKSLTISTQNLDEIIKDLSLILQVREQDVHEKKEEIYLPQLVDDIRVSINNIMLKEKVVLLCHFNENEYFFSIRTYLHSVFYNLILNSIKYKQPGIAPVINIHGHRLENALQITFEDNGKGIDLNRNGKDIFGLYKRFDTKVEGKGIGLFMVKSQVENLGGNITVESELGKGTTFTVVLPV